MLVTPILRKFGKYKPGEPFELPARTAKVFIRIGKLVEVTAEDIQKAEIETRSMQPTETVVVDAPYGYKADGTPRKRPGRPAGG